jgi:pyruvate dehydrogenase E2 component (dihydrolipoamide acetyltransferase)
MAIIEIKVPDIGDLDEVAVIELLVKPGDTVTEEQSLITVESDKASMEIPSSANGIVKELKVQIGDKVKQGSLVLMLEVAGVAASAPAVATAPTVTSTSPVAPVVPSSVAPATSTGVVAGSDVMEIHVPDIGDFKDVSVIELLVKAGDAIAVDQSLITVESDKASMEIPSSHAGVLKELKVKIGQTVNIGDLLAILTGTSPVASKPAEASASVAHAANVVAPAVAPAPVATPSKPAAAAMPHSPSTAPNLGLPHASPSVRKFARELGVPLEEVTGSGRKGRITDADVQAFTKSVMSGVVQTKAQAAKAPASGGGSELGLLAWPKVDFAKFGPVERKDLSRIKKISGANLHRNWVMIPHVTSYEDADITDLEALRVRINKENEKTGIKVTMLAFVIKAAVSALKKFPEFNASLDGDQLVLKNYWNIGFAADTPNGLVVPVLKDADKKGLLEISTEMAALSKKARDGKLSAGDMQGGTFSISSLGGIGTTYFTPLINAPEVAILGLSKNAMKPVWDGKAFQPRLTLPLSLSYDHRVIDGASGARFNAYLSQALADLRRVLL